MKVPTSNLFVSEDSWPEQLIKNTLHMSFYRGKNSNFPIVYCIWIVFYNCDQHYHDSKAGKNLLSFPV